MINIDKSQYKMLKRIKTNKSLQFQSLTNEEINICEYLISIKSIKCTYAKASVKTINGIVQISNNISSIQITEKGKADIYSFRSTFYKWWTPVIVSIISLILSSILSILMLLMK